MKAHRWVETGIRGGKAGGKKNLLTCSVCEARMWAWDVDVKLSRSDKSILGSMEVDALRGYSVDCDLEVLKAVIGS